MIESSAETVYADDVSRVMSSDIQALADSVYKEFERVIRAYDEGAVKGLMPLIVGILEGLDRAVQDKLDYEVELEMVREDNGQLMTQYEREKQLRRNYEQKYLAFEDSTFEECKERQGKIESLESIIRLLEIKMKNAQDQISRFEERETENKKEYNKLHERYTDVFKAHIDYREKMKFIGSEKASVDSLQNRRIVSQAPPSVDPAITLSSANGPGGFSIRTVDSGSPYPSRSRLTVAVGDNVSIEEELKGISKQKHIDEKTRNSRETREIDMDTDDVSAYELGTGTISSSVHAIKESFSASYDSASAALELVLSESSEAEVDTLIISNQYHQALAGDFPSLPTTEFHETEDFGNRPGNSGLVSVFDELSGQDMDALGQIDDGADIVEMENEVDRDSNVSDNFYGVSREVENLIQENNELLATKNALNVVKDDLIARVDQLTGEKELFREEVRSLEVVRDKLKTRTLELEDEIKKLRDVFEEEKKKMSLNDEDEDDVPMIQRKRFTRVEMARVLLERNQYKERLLELQEVVRWTEMIRASTHNVDFVNKKKSGLWNFFSNLFSSSSKSTKETEQMPTLRHIAPGAVLMPGFHHQRPPQSHTPKAEEEETFDFLTDDLNIHVADGQECRGQGSGAGAKCDDHGCLQAYGWLLPSKFQVHTITEATAQKTPRLPIPVPVYCQPIMEEEAATKLLCAAAVDLTGGKGWSSVVGGSNFCSTDEVEKPNEDIEVHEKYNRVSTETDPSSLIWICSASKHGSEVTIIDANSPADVLGSFIVSSSPLLCIASIPGAMEDDYKMIGDDIQGDDHPTAEVSTGFDSSTVAGENVGLVTRVRCSARNTESGSSDNSAEADGDVEAIGGNGFLSAEVNKFDSSLPTMWLGSQSGSIFVHSTVSNWKRCLHSFRLKDSILSIIHVKGRVFVALANGSVAVFHRDSFGRWDFSDYHLVTMGEPQYSVRCSCVVADKHVWFGYQNTIRVLDPKTLRIEKSFNIHPRKENQVRQMVWIGDGVWLSIRLDSTLQLYHAYTHEHLQNIDIEPHVSKLLGNGNSLGFSLVRISCLMASCNRLWIGTGNGVVLSIPLSERNDHRILTSVVACSSNGQAVTSSGCGRPAGIARVYADAKTDADSPGSFIPYCSIGQTQLSFHGYMDAVKFFASVPGLPSKGVSVSPKEKIISCETVSDESKNSNRNLLIVSGGEGYVDFRLGKLDDLSSAKFEEKADQTLSRRICSHLIVWQVITSG